MNLSTLKVNDSVWKVHRDLNGYPLDVKQWILLLIGGKANERLTFYNMDEREFVYAHHYNDDWHATKAEAIQWAVASLQQKRASLERQFQELEVLELRFDYRLME